MFFKGMQIDVFDTRHQSSNEQFLRQSANDDMLYLACISIG